MLNENSLIKLIECPRDAMQGWSHFIPTAQKIKYINSLLKIGFDTIDFGSFVSAKAIPQLADTEEVLDSLDVDVNQTKLLAIVANERGAAQACGGDKITYLGFPFSVSPTFQQRNTNSSMEESFDRVKDIRELCGKKNKQLVIYISMGFGNIYGDDYSSDIVLHWVDEMVKIGIKTISIADTVGVATPQQVKLLLNSIIPLYPAVEIGVHLHSTPIDWQAKVNAALKAGCTRFDGALKGIGGCPMAGNELVGNMDTELMIPYFNDLNLLNNLNKEALQYSSRLANEIFV